MLPTQNFILLLFFLLTILVKSENAFLAPILKNAHNKYNINSDYSINYEKYLLVPFSNLYKSYNYANQNVNVQNLKIQESKIRMINDHTLGIKVNFEDCIASGYLSLETLKLYNAQIKCKNDQLSSNFARTVKLTPEKNSEIFNYFKISKYIPEAGTAYIQFLKKYRHSDLAIKLDQNDPNFISAKDIYNYEKRFPTFVKNLVKIAYLNLLERGSAIYDISEFSDLSSEEFDKFYKLPKNIFPEFLKNKKSENYLKINFEKLVYAPDAFDWRDQNAVTEVKNQGQCGSCWSFSTTGNVEGVYAVKTKKLISLSEQELVDCDNVDQGCNGGLMDNAFQQIENLGGLESEEDYKYTAHMGECHFQKDKIAVNIDDFKDVPVGDENAMQAQLLETGPLAVALNAMWMQFYTKGVSHPWKRLCSPAGLDHGVLVVGYGVEPADPSHKPFPKKEQPFWVIKNSWGGNWGEKGYYRLFRGDGSCGIDQAVSTSIIN